MTRQYNQTKPFTQEQLDKLWKEYTYQCKRTVNSGHLEELNAFGDSLHAWQRYSESWDAVPEVPTLRKPTVLWLKAMRRTWNLIEHPHDYTECEFCGKVYHVNIMGTHKEKKHVR